jgi:hypothetical protein
MEWPRLRTRGRERGRERENMDKERVGEKHDMIKRERSQ